jgi:hypothetical protein
MTFKIKVNDAQHRGDVDGDMVSKHALSLS